MQHASCLWCSARPMVPARYVLLVWSLALLAPWLALWARCPRARPAMLWSSFFALPFGLTEVMFAGTYWSPPTLFDLARRVHVDVESFVFLFAAGGIAASIYEGITGRNASVRGAREKRERRRELYNAALATPALVFAPGLIVLHEPIWAGIVAMCAGAGARVACRPDLAPKTFVGGLLFAGLYVAMLASLTRLEPGYVGRVWSSTGMSHGTIAGLPVTELLFGASFGAYWSGLYEHWHWTFARARPRILHRDLRRRS